MHELSCVCAEYAHVLRANITPPPPSSLAQAWSDRLGQLPQFNLNNYRRCRVATRNVRVNCGHGEYRGVFALACDALLLL